MRNRIFIVLVLGAGFVFGGNVCTWKGGSGKFSDDNWDVKPVSGNGDTLVFDTSDGTAITVENDVQDEFGLAMLKTCQGTGWASFGQITITGKSLYFNTATDWTTIVMQSGSIVYSQAETMRGAKLQFDVPLRFTGGQLRMGNAVTFNKALTIDDDTTWAFEWSYRMTSSKPTFTFNDAISAPNAVLDITPGNGGHGSKVDFNGTVTCRELYCNGSSLDISGKPTLNFNAAGNKLGIFHFKYNYFIYFNTAGALDESTILDDLAASQEKSEITLKADQTIDRIQKAPTGNRAYMGRIVASTASTLTMNATTDTTVSTTFMGPLRLVWNPKENFTFTLDEDGVSDTNRYKRTNTIATAICVNRGTFALSNNVYFTALSRVSVAKDATFSFLKSTHPQPLPASCVFDIATGGKVAIPEGKTVTTACIYLDGQPLMTPGAYTQANCDWVSGGGTLDYTPQMIATSVGNAMGETCWNLTKNWTNTILNVSVAPKDMAAAGYDYLIASDYSLRAPQAGGLYTWRMHKMTIGIVGGTKGYLYDCSYSGTLTNLFENEGLELANGSISYMSGRFGTSCWKGKITVTSPEGDNRFAFGAGQTNATLEARFSLAGTLHGASGTGFKMGGGDPGVKKVIEADASDFYGTLTGVGNTGWIALGNIVFNGTVVCQDGCAFGPDTATDKPQVKDLSFKSATPFVIPADYATRVAGCVTVTNAFTQSAQVTVYHLGRMWRDWTPILKLAPTCSGTLDKSLFTFGGAITKRLQPTTDATLNKPNDLHLEVKTEADGSQVLYLVSIPVGTAIIVR